MRIETAFRRHYHVTYFADLRTAASIVQSAWRLCTGYRNRTLLLRVAADAADRQWTAAAAIQRVWRGYAARSGPAAAQRARNAALQRAALRVQVAWYKRNRMYSALVLMRSLYAVHACEVEEARLVVVHHRLACAGRIQALWRGWVGRQRAAWLRGRRDRASQVQAWWRWERFSRTLRRLWVCVGIIAQQSRTARRLQAWWLRCKPGRMLASLQVGEEGGGCGKRRGLPRGGGADWSQLPPAP